MIYKMKIEPITFVHIGSGQEIDFFSYIILDKTFYRINISNFYSKLKKLENKEKFASILDKLSSKNKEELKKGRQDFRELLEKGIKYLKENAEKNKGIIIYQAKIDDELYQKYIEKKDEFENQFIVYESMRTGLDFLQYIPGSSIKGAMRTALLSYIINNLGLLKDDFKAKGRLKDGKDYEGFILGNYFYDYEKDKIKRNIQKDPFRVLQISDTSFFDKDSTLITESKNYHMKRNKFGEFNIYTEYIMQGKLAEFELSINTDHFNDKYDGIMKNTIKNKEGRNIKFKEFFTIENIAKACNEFYLDKLENDYNKFYNNINEAQQKIKIIEKQDIKKSIDPNKKEFLIRLGKFSQFECITMDNLRNDPGKLKSRNLVLYNGMYYPAGWAKITWEEFKK